MSKQENCKCSITQNDMNVEVSDQRHAPATLPKEKQSKAPIGQDVGWVLETV
jgi:hypothetical protein